MALSRQQRLRYGRLAVFVSLSLAVHLGCFWGFVAKLDAPKLDMSFEWPNAVELGDADTSSDAFKQAMAALQGGQHQEAPQQEETQPEAAEAPATNGIAESSASNEESETDTDEQRSTDDDRESSEAAKDAAISGKDLQAALARGSLLRLGVDMKQVRALPYKKQVSRLLSAIPDWTILLGRSGVDPVEDLDQVLIASPDFRRSQMVVAGIYNSAKGSLDSILEEVARKAGRPTGWRHEKGIRVTDWPTEERTRRVLAKVGARHFLIGRSEDIPKVLALIAARKTQKSLKAQPIASKQQSLLELDKGEVLSFDANQARLFAKGPDHVVPVALSARIRVANAPRQTTGKKPAPDTSEAANTTGSPSSHAVTIEVTGRFDTPAEAKKAFAYWSQKKQAFATNILVAMSGMGPVLTKATLEQKGDSVIVEAHLSEFETEQVLRLLTATLRQGGGPQGF